MHYARGSTPPPPLVFPATWGGSTGRRVTTRPAALRTSTPRAPSGTPTSASDFAPPPDGNGAGLEIVTNPSYVPNGKTVKLQRPIDTPLRLLPGRLQIIAGEDQGQDIRFVRVPGEIPTVTIGREEGPPDRHIRLRASTVSRLHARMQFEDGRWRITNLSQTNPLVLNGETLSVTAGSRWLDEGDRIEIGEVVLRFRER